MRVIAGDFKGRKIEALKGDNTRPTSDKIKESVFNMLGQFFEGGSALDLFAGSGNLGIESLSRGIEHVVFIDKEFSAVKVIKENLANFKLTERTEVYRNDAFKAMSVLGKKGKTFDLIFLDPPYTKFDMTAILQEIVKQQLIKNAGLIMCEEAAGFNVSLDDLPFDVVKNETYGATEILILKKVEN